MSELDLNGIFLTEFPDSMTIEEFREKLEFEIFMYYQEQTLLTDEEKEMFAVIEPINVSIAISRIHRREPGFEAMAHEYTEKWLKERLKKSTKSHN